MNSQNVVAGLFIFFLGEVIGQTDSTRRGRCEEKAALQAEIRNFQESQEVLRGEVASLREALDSVSSLVAYSLPEDCSAAKARGSWTSTTMIKPPGLPPRLVRCEQREQGGGWTVILARRPTNNPVNFNTTWQNYKDGFGDISEEFWIGNEVLHKLTREIPHQLRVVITDWSDTKEKTATWNMFVVGSEDNRYKLGIDGYSPHISTASDELQIHNGSSFSTHDYDNDIDTEHCARQHGGGWWYFQCYTANPTGKILTPFQTGDHGMIWGVHPKKLTLRSLTMMIRPVSPAPYHH